MFKIYTVFSVLYYRYQKRQFFFIAIDDKVGISGFLYLVVDK